MERDCFEEIVRILEPYKRPGQTIHRGTEINSEFELDSLAMMNLLLEIEDRFDISIPLNVIPELRTVGDLAEVVQEYREER